MSHNDHNPQRVAWRHRPALLGIAAALLLALIAALVFGGMQPGEDDPTVADPMPEESAVAPAPEAAPAN